VSLHGADPASDPQGIARPLGSEAFTVISDLDRSFASLNLPSLLLEVRPAEAGHVFTVASAVEREIRRLEAVTADAGGTDGLITVTLEPIDAGRTPLARWPRLTLALAASAVSDLGFHLSDSVGAQFAVELVRRRNRVVAGGLPHRAVTMVISGRAIGVTRQVTVVTTGEGGVGGTGVAAGVGRGAWVDPALN
jgi:hypothetical protein